MCLKFTAERIGDVLVTQFGNEAALVVEDEVGIAWTRGDLRRLLDEVRRYFPELLDPTPAEQSPERSSQQHAAENVELRFIMDHIGSCQRAIGVVSMAQAFARAFSVPHREAIKKMPKLLGKLVRKGKLRRTASGRYTHRDR